MCLGISSTYQLLMWKYSSSSFLLNWPRYKHNLRLLCDSCQSWSQCSPFILYYKIVCFIAWFHIEKYILVYNTGIFRAQNVVGAQSSQVNSSFVVIPLHVWAYKEQNAVSCRTTVRHILIINTNTTLDIRAIIKKKNYA